MSDEASPICPSCGETLDIEGLALSGSLKRGFVGLCVFCGAEFEVEDVKFIKVAVRVKAPAKSVTQAVQTAVDAAALTAKWTAQKTYSRYNVYIGDFWRVVPQYFPAPGKEWVSIKQLVVDLKISARVVSQLRKDRAIAACFDLLHESSDHPYRSWYRILDPVKVRRAQEERDEPVRRRAQMWMLHYAQGVTVSEISKKLNVSPRTVRASLARVNQGILREASRLPPPNAPNWWWRLARAGAVGGRSFDYWTPSLPEDGCEEG